MRETLTRLTPNNHELNKGLKEGIGERGYGRVCLSMGIWFSLTTVLLIIFAFMLVSVHLYQLCVVANCD